MCECLWSDPQPAKGRAPSKRGIGVSFGPDVTRRFLADNKLDLIVRSHEVRLHACAASWQAMCIRSTRLLLSPQLVAQVALPAVMSKPASITPKQVSGACRSRSRAMRWSTTPSS